MDAQAKQNQKDRVLEVRGSPVLTEKDKRNAKRRTEEYRAKRRATRDLSKDRERWAKYYEANKEKLRERSRNYGARPEVKEYKKEYHKKEYVEKGKQRGLDGIKNLTDNYVKAVLTKDTRLSYKDIPKEMIEAKRFEMLIRRDYLANTTPEQRFKISKEKYKKKLGILPKSKMSAEETKARRRARARERYVVNIEKEREANKKYREANREKINAKQRAKHAENKEEINAKRRNLTPEERAHINELARAAVKRRKLLNKENQDEKRN